jgi:hypothetical protein
MWVGGYNWVKEGFKTIYLHKYGTFQGEESRLLEQFGIANMKFKSSYEIKILKYNNIKYIDIYIMANGTKKN